MSHAAKDRATSAVWCSVVGILRALGAIYERKPERILSAWLPVQCAHPADPRRTRGKSNIIKDFRVLRLGVPIGCIDGRLRAAHKSMT
jgi:hypothetical protein